MKRNVYIFRHGETHYNRSKRFTGRINSRLTPKGISQIKVIAEKLRDKKFQVAFKTSLSRTSDSLRIVLKHHPECGRIIVDDRIIERSYGDLGRKYHRTVIKKYGKKQFDIWHRSYDIPPPGGESIKMMEKRVLARARAGSSRSMGTVLLAATTRNPEIRATINIMYSDEIIVICNDLGMETRTYEWEEKPKAAVEFKCTVPWTIEKLDEVSEIVYDIGDFGVEASVIIFGSTAVDVANKAVKISNSLINNF